MNNHPSKGFVSTENISYSIVIALVAVMTTNYFLPLIAFIIVIYAYRIWEENLIIFLTLSSFLLITSELSEVFRLFLNLTNLFVLVFFAFFHKKRFYKTKLLPKQVLIFVLILLSSLVISAIFSDYMLESLYLSVQQTLFLLLCICYFLLLDGNRTLNTLVYSLIFVALIVSISVLYQFIELGTNAFYLQEKIIIRTSGLYNNPNGVGLLLCCTIPLMLAFFFRRGLKMTTKCLFGGLIVFFFVVLMITDSRASILAICVSVSVFLYRLNKLYFYRFLKLSFLISLIVLLLFPQMLDYAILLIRADRIIVSTRNYFWEEGFQMFNSSPIFGVGPGLFDKYLYKYLPVMLGTFEEQQMNWAISGTAHNFFIFRLAEVGIIGLIPGVMLIALFLSYSNKLLIYFKSLNFEKYLLTLSIFSIGIGMTLRGFFESNGILTHGWITRDFPFWINFIIILYFVTEKKKSLDLQESNSYE